MIKETNLKTNDEIYPKVENLIKELQRMGTSKLAAVLEHRMHKVAWTTRQELLEELENVLRKATKETSIETRIHQNVLEIRELIADELSNP